MVPANFLKERIAGMKKLNDLEFLRLSKAQKFGYRIRRFFTGIPAAIGHFFLALWHLLQKAGQTDRKSTRLNSSHPTTSRMPSSA